MNRTIVLHVTRPKCESLGGNIASDESLAFFLKALADSAKSVQVMKCDKNQYHLFPDWDWSNP